MMTDDSCRKILTGLGGPASAQKAEPYIRGRICLYAYLYLLAESGGAIPPASASLRQLLEADVIPDDIRDAIRTLAAEAGGKEAFGTVESVLAGSDPAVRDRCTKENVTAFFEQTYGSFLTGYSTTGTPESLYPLIEFLLDPAEEDDVADFYGNAGFSRYLGQKRTVRSVSCFEPMAEDWLFARMHGQLTGTRPPYRCVQADLGKGTDGLGLRFSRIYAFPPFYQKMTSAESSNNLRVVRNMQRSTEDRTERLLRQVLDCLAEDGRAVVLVSNALFTRSYAGLQKELVEGGRLTKVINLPHGTAYPRNVSASLLLFENRKGNPGIRFVDLRPLASTPRLLAPEGRLPELLSADSVPYSRFVPSEQIIARGYDLNGSSYLGMHGQAGAQAEAGISAGADRGHAAGTPRRAPFVLGREAQIFRGMQDMDAFRILEQDSAGGSSFYGGDRYLRIMDIEDNRIRDTMPYIEWRGQEQEKFMLTNRDIVLSKTAVPIKVAVPEAPFIYPAGNIFIIRLKEDSDLNRYYLKCFLESEEGTRRLRMLSSGSSLVSFTKGSLERLEIPFRSAAAQQELEQQYRSCEARIRQLEGELAKLRQDQRGYLAGMPE